MISDRADPRSRLAESPGDGAARHRRPVDLRVDPQTLSGIELVIFDKDGTLIELHHYWGQMVRLRAAILREALSLTGEHEAGARAAMGLDDRTGRLRPEGPVGLKKREVVVEAVSAYLAASGYAEPEEVCRDAFARADERSLQRLGDFVAPINGAAELLRALREAGCLVALATVDLHERANLTLEHLGWSNLFDLVVGGDEVARAKPHPEAVERVLAALQVAPGRAVMIGDALNDVRMGIDAGIAAVGVTTGFASRAELLTATPLVAASVRDIEIVPAPA